MRPKEHGAYAILAIPMLTALAMAGPTLVGACIGVAAIAGFLAHEPLLIAWGHRGRRAQLDPSATLRLGVCGVMALMAGTVALFLGSNDVRIALGLCLTIALIGFAVAVLGKHRSLFGQLWGVVALSAPFMPLLLAGNTAIETTIQIWLTWILGFVATTFAVHSVIAAQKRKPRNLHRRVLLIVTAIAVLGGIWETHYLLCVIPMLLAAWALDLWPPPAKYLKRVGWSLVVATFASAVSLVVTGA